MAAARVAASLLASMMPASISGASNSGSGWAAVMAAVQLAKSDLGGNDGISGASTVSESTGT